jgi:hypothetical protein
VGLAAWLLGIHNPEQVQFHAQRGALFETFVVMEVLKSRLNAGLPLNLFYWRDSKGLEIDLILENGGTLFPVEIKSGQTLASDYFNGLKHWAKISDCTEQPAWLVYGGDQTLTQGAISIVPWTDIVSHLPVGQ